MANDTNDDQFPPALFRLEDLARDRFIDIVEAAGDTRGGDREHVLRPPPQEPEA